ncbi:DUF4843 domain-containing protein [Parapedobacter deserti]|uniref:DUF4843 domain-containing protein n=1 Tax=Parapedobacter deserti TaxID=1912957 RepID=A0ABV7JM16_9SPHI
MKKRTIYGLLALLLILGCKEDERLMFEDEASVYFGAQLNNGGFYSLDSLNYSFAFEPEEVEQDTFYVYCRITGLAADHDRRINFVADEGNDAKSGYHYEILNPLIPAGQYGNDIAIVLYRQPGLRDSLVTALLRIEDSEDLRAGYDDTGAQPVGRSEYTRREFKFTITDQLLKPTNWDSSWLSSFGEYSEVKIRFISSVTGYTNWGSNPLPQDRNFIVQTAYQALYNYEQQNGDLIDENGNPVKFY